MAEEFTRYVAPHPATVAEGWTLERLTPVARLFGANGMRTGTDGRIYVAQVAGSQVSAINPDTGAVETISPMGSDIVGPDDLAFDEEGNLYLTEITENRVSMLSPNGTTRVLQGDMPVANPITYHQGHLFAGECRMGARIMELDRNGGAPRILVDNIPMTNAFDVGPDGKLYYPIMATSEIWKVGLDGGEPEKVAEGLGMPNSVKFHPDGYIVSTQVASGQVLRIDPRTGDKTVLADLIPGLDNVTFVGKRIFISSIPGIVWEILEPGKVREVIPFGFNGPLDIAMDPGGFLWVADGSFLYSLQPGGKPEVTGMLFSPGYPGYIRGMASSGPGEVIVATSLGNISRYRPAQQESEVLAQGFDRLYGVALASDGTVFFAEAGRGRALSVRSGKVEELASGLSEPRGVAITADGSCLMADRDAGRVVKVSGGRAEVIVDGLQHPEGIFARGNLLYILDTMAKELIEFDLDSGARRTIASNLPVGAPPGVVPKFLGGIGDMAGPMGPFAGLTEGPDGTIYLSADAEGTVMALRPA